MLHQQTYDAAEVEIGRRQFVRYGRLAPRRFLPNCARLADAEIMRDSRPNDKRESEMRARRASYRRKHTARLTQFRYCAVSVNVTTG